MPLLNLSVSQLLWVFVATNLLSKLKPNRLFLRWLASGGLTCYRVPSNEDLKRLQYTDKREGNSKKPKAGGGGGGKSKGKQSNEPPSSLKTSEFKIRSSDLVKLNMTKVDIDSRVLLSAPYGEDLEWVIDLAFMSLVSFLLTQAIFYLSPRTYEYNFSLVWVYLVIFQALLMLSQLTLIYFKNDVSIGERSICIVSGCSFLLIAMLVLTADATHLELKVSESLQSLSRASSSSAARLQLPNEGALLDPDEIDTPPPDAPLPRPAYLIVIKLLMAVICSLVGVIFTFPGFRFGQLHESFVANVTKSKLDKLLHNINYISPILVVCLWIPTASRNLMRKQEFVLVDDEKFETIRICLVILVNALRFVVVRRYVQTFLSSGANRIDRIRFRGGTTTNREIQVSVASMNNYVNVVAVQYILPTLICLFTSIVFATLTHSNANSHLNAAMQSSNGDDSSKKLASLRYLFGTDQQALIESAEETLFSIRRLFSSDFLKNMFGFATWWFHFSWFCTTTAGVVYHKYITH